MTREEKSKYIDDLAVEIQDSSVFYITDTSELPVDQINAIRRKCFQSNISLRVVKNALLQKAFEKVEGRDLKEFDSTLKGGTSIMFSEVGNAPAKLIKEFITTHLFSIFTNINNSIPGFIWFHCQCFFVISKQHHIHCSCLIKLSVHHL